MHPRQVVEAQQHLDIETKTDRLLLGRLTYLVMTICSASMFFAANRVKRNTEQTVAIFFKDAVQSATVADQVWISSMYILGFDPGGENALTSAPKFTP